MTTILEAQPKIAPRFGCYTIFSEMDTLEIQAGMVGIVNEQENAVFSPSQ